ncbi:MAG: rhomboid family intramembrane serine protease [Vicinamibacteria bacterium]
MIPLKDNLPSLRTPLLTIFLIAASVVLYIAGWDPDLADTWWPLAAVASLFVSDGFIELVVNMLFLWLFAKSLEDTLGRGRLLALFLVAGIAAAAAQELLDPDTVVPSVGVAGAIAGLIGAYALLYPRARTLCWVLIPFFVTFVEVPALILAVVWFALQALDAVGQPPLSGLIGGLVLGVAAVRPLAHGRPRVTVEASQPVY